MANSKNLHSDLVSLYDLRPGNKVGPNLTASEPTRGKATVEFISEFQYTM